MPPTSEAVRPLSGVRVLDMSRVIAGPVAARILTDLGADVVKLEPPSEDIARYVAPKGDRGMSGLYTMANVGKRNVCIDLAQAEGREIVLGLVRWADVMLENFRPGVMASLGLGWETLRAENPKLVLASINGFGSDNSASDRPAYAPTIHAVAGVLQYTAEWTGNPLSQLADNQADIQGSLHATIGLLAALLRARETGSGCHVEIPLFDALLATYSETPFALLDPPEHRAECQLFDAASLGTIAVAGSPQNLWYQLQRHYDLKDPAPGDLPISQKAAARHRAIEEWMAAQPDLETMQRRLVEAGLAAERVESLRDALSGPIARENQLVEHVDDRRGGQRPVVRMPYRFDGTRGGLRGPAPLRGEHNNEVLAEILGYDEAQVADLTARGVLAADPRPSR